MADLARLREKMTAREPADLRGYLVPVTEDRLMMEGTTVRALQLRFAARQSGLLVPEAYARGHAPIDAMYHYLTASEVLGYTPDPAEVGEHLARVPLTDVLMKVAVILAALREPGADRHAVDRRFVAELREPYRTRVTNLLRDPGAAFIAPQCWIGLAKLACRVSGDDVLPTTTPGDLHYAALVLAQHLGADIDTTEAVTVGAEPSRFSHELIANQVFNSHQSEPHLFGRFVRRWIELPTERCDDPRVVQLRDVFEQVTGVPLDDFMMVGCGLWATASQLKPRVLPGYFDGLGLTSERVEAVLRLVSVDLAHLRALVMEETARFGLDWAVSTFSQYPVVRLFDGSHLVLDPALLLNRMFGTLPMFDIVAPLRDGGRADQKLAGTVKGCVEHLGEVYAHEVLTSIFAGGPVQRLYDGDALRAAYPTSGRKIADAAVDYGHSWVVVETTTSQLRRETVAGMGETFLAGDLDKLVEEVAQIDSTIRFLREDERPLTGRLAAPGRRFTPVLVVAEGFPVNPMSLTLLRERVAQQGLLAGRDIDPLEVLDTEELEMVEGLQEAGGSNLRDLLAAKRRSNFWADSLRNYLLFEVSAGVPRPERLNQLWERAFKPTLRRLVENDAA